MQSDIVAAIDRERAYQDAKYGTPAERQLPALEYLGILNLELLEAWAAPHVPEALCELLQVIAVGVACMEQHGVFERPENRSPTQAQRLCECGADLYNHEDEHSVICRMVT